MKIAIHHRKGSFSDRWIDYCKRNGISYKLVDAYSNDIITELSDCDIFMWHHHHADYRDMLFAKQLIYSIESKGITVFPNFKTTWHFDDKVGEKYLLEAVEAPIVPSYIFYTKKEAHQWAESTEYPKVFKLRGGAGASNVKLIHSKGKAHRVINRAFGRGFKQFSGWSYFKDRLNKWRNNKDTFIGVIKGFGRIFIPTTFSKMYSTEKGYAYFQEFIPQNYFDIRVIVIGDKAFAIKRMCRKNDFRASGSGDIRYDRNEIPIECVKTAFNVNDKLDSQCTAFDFVFNSSEALIVEISYGFAMKGYDACPGFWTSDLEWHEGSFVPQDWMIENAIKMHLNN